MTPLTQSPGSHVRLVAMLVLLAALAVLAGAAPALAAAPDHLVVKVSPQPAAVGTDVKVTVVAKDSSGSTIADYTAPATWTDGSGALTPSAPSDFVKGVSTTTAQIGTPVHGDVITVESGGTLGQSRAFNVLGPVDHFDVGVPASNQLSGPFTITAYARDAVGNLVTNYAAGAGLADAANALPTALNDFVKGVSRTAVRAIGPAHRDVATVENADAIGKSKAFNVLGGFDHYDVGVPASVTADTPFTLTVSARDGADNLLTGYEPSTASVQWSSIGHGEIANDAPGSPGNGGDLGPFAGGVSRTTLRSFGAAHAIVITVDGARSRSFNALGTPSSFFGIWKRTDGQTGCDSITGSLTFKVEDAAGNFLRNVDDPNLAWGTFVNYPDPLGTITPESPAPIVNGVSVNPSVSIDGSDVSAGEHLELGVLGFATDPSPVFTAGPIC